MYSCGSRRGLKDCGSSSRRSSIMAELKAAKTVAPFGTSAGARGARGDDVPSAWRRAATPAPGDRSASPRRNSRRAAGHRCRAPPVARRPARPAGAAIARAPAAPPSAAAAGRRRRTPSGRRGSRRRRSLVALGLQARQRPSTSSLSLGAARRLSISVSIWARNAGAITSTSARSAGSLPPSANWNSNSRVAPDAEIPPGGFGMPK